MEIRKKKNIQEKVLLISLLLAPFTALEIGGLSFSNIGFIILFILQAYRKKGRLGVSKEVRFFIIFACCFTIGFTLNQLIYPLIGRESTGNIGGLLFNISAYGVSILGIIGVNSYYQEQGTGTYSLVRKWFYTGSIILMILYILQLRIGSIFGYSLRYYSYFCPLATNIHHVSMILGPLGFIGLYVAEQEVKMIKKIATVLLSICVLYLSIQTGSSKAVLGCIAGGAIAVFSIVFRMNYVSRKTRIVILTLMSLCIIMVVLLNIDYIINYLAQTFTEIDGGGARSYLYKEAVRLILESPAFGRGPMAHVLSKSGIYYDTHSTLLTVCIQGGFISLIAYVNLWRRYLLKTYTNGYIFAAMIYILLYAIGGDIVRRVPVWIILVLINTLMVADDREKVVENHGKQFADHSCYY